MATRRLPAKERRRLILLAAIRVFARSGFHGSTTKEIAAEAGVAEALLYRYFDSKQTLFIESMRLTASRMVEEIEKICDQNRANPAGAVGDLITYYRQLTEKHADFAKMVFVVTAELDDPRVREVYLPFQDRSLSILEKTVRSFQDAGIVNPHVPARATAWLLLGCFQVIALMKHTGRLGELHIEPAMNMVRTFLETGIDSDEVSRSLQKGIPAMNLDKKTQTGS